MARTTQEWVGRNDDDVPPDYVRVRVFDRCRGICHMCGRVIRAGERWILEHLKAIINGGLNRESNLGLTCCLCLPKKNAADLAEKSETYHMRKKHVLPSEPSRGFRKPEGVKYNWSTGRYERERT